MENNNGFDVHPLSNTHFFEFTTPAEELNDSNILIRLRNDNISYEGIYKVHAWRHPTLPQFTAIIATSWSYRGAVGVWHRLSFDAQRAAKIRSANKSDHKFTADLGDLQPMRQVPEVWDAVQREFNNAMSKIDSDGLFLKKDA